MNDSKLTLVNSLNKLRQKIHISLTDEQEIKILFSSHPTKNMSIYCLTNCLLDSSTNILHDKQFNSFSFFFVLQHA